MNEQEHQQVLADESSAERQYRSALWERAGRPRQNEVDRNTWTGGRHAEFDLPRDGWIIGRVALDGPSDYLDGDADFYIGSDHLEINGTEVFSWAAPVSCTYYRKSTDFHHPLCQRVIGVRTFAHEIDRIVEYQDEALTASAPQPLFARRALSIPRAPGRQVLTTVAVEQAEQTEHEPVTVPTTPDSQTKSAKPVAPTLRAGEILRRQLKAPKKVAMAAVLATLQSDQYDLITRPWRDNEFLQGHPGTGKTIIAVHRAAFLLNSQASDEDRLPPGGRILIVGPTGEYKSHISSALRGLIDRPSRYSVASMSEILNQLSGHQGPDTSTKASSYLDVESRLAKLVDRAVMRARATKEAPLTLSRVYAELIGFLQDPPDGSLDGEWVTYFRALPRTYEDIRALRRPEHRALLAYIGARVDRPSGQFSNLRHIIVDEAQDVHPLEWAVLGLLGNSGGWTILGDLNQRRTDVTYSGWDPIAEALAIEEDNGKAPVTILDRGYRSTAQIMHFANQLLKKEDRGLVSLQASGVPPKIVRATSAKEVNRVAVGEAISLKDHLSGTVAVIGVDTVWVSRTLQSLGWTAALGDTSTWSKNDMTLRVLAPDRARGLEFDGVVVVEPAAFPMNYGRQGVLYTALTRANRELVVVHGQALPKELHR